MKLERYCRGNYIGGHFVKVGDPNGEISSRNPGDLEVPKLAFPFSYEHIHESCEHARRALPAWRRLPVLERYGYLAKLREALNQRSKEIAHGLSFEIGKPLWESEQELKDSLDLMNSFLTQGSQTSVELKVPDPEESCSGTIRFFPRGVFAIISPAIQPVYVPISHFVPALLNGNTIVLKSSKYAPMTGQLLATCAHEAGLPSGVFNLVHGDSEAARRLTLNSSISGILFTGMHETAAKIKKQIFADFGKILVVEAGAQNSVLVWDDCHYEQALRESLFGAFVSSGQRCTSTSRIAVHEKIFTKFRNDFHQLAKKCAVGYPLDTQENQIFMGPLVTEAATEDYLRYQGIASREGCEEIMRGKTLERDKKGYYVSPSIYHAEKLDPKSVFQRSEIQGPNVLFYRLKNVDEALEFINFPLYGMAASIYSGHREIFLQLAEHSEVGMLNWNRPTTHVSHQLPYGGIKKSGTGRPMGSYAGLQCTYPVSLLECEPGKGIALPSALPRLG